MVRRLLKPRAVLAGARVAVVAPASSAKPERIELGLAALRRRGFDASAAAHALGKEPPFFSGTAAERLDDLRRAFADPKVGAIFCIRGGYGSNYLLEDLDLELVAKNPKPFLGYSDLTTMQTWFLDQLGLVGFHGPMVAADFYREGGVHEASFEAAVKGGLVAAGATEGLRILKPGRARGVVYGGCLSILTFALGTRFAPQTEGKLLFIEDVATKPYQVDRMLRQMLLAGKFDGVAGLVFGEMLECTSPGASLDASRDLLDDVILRVFDWFEG
ncbi:MAG: LD-carboxypeptidase, partial [Silvibacterium sp.]|nr:LD-carboxypeptidase [Silvibacterium sp.]